MNIVMSYIKMSSTTAQSMIESYANEIFTASKAEFTERITAEIRNKVIANYGDLLEQDEYVHDLQFLNEIKTEYTDRNKTHVFKVAQKSPGWCIPEDAYKLADRPIGIVKAYEVIRDDRITSSYVITEFLNVVLLERTINTTSGNQHYSRTIQGGAFRCRKQEPGHTFQNPQASQDIWVHCPKCYEKELLIKYAVPKWLYDIIRPVYVYTEHTKTHTTTIANIADIEMLVDCVKKRQQFNPHISHRYMGELRLFEAEKLMKEVKREQELIKTEHDALNIDRHTFEVQKTAYEATRLNKLIDIDHILRKMKTLAIHLGIESKDKYSQDLISEITSSLYDDTLTELSHAK